MITIRDTASVDQLGQVELQQLIRDRIAEITQGQPYDADVYGEFVIVEAGGYCGPLSQDNNVSSLRWLPVSCS